MPEDGLSCWIYKSLRREEMYLYLASENGFDCVPAVLRERFGPPVFVMELELHPGRRLAREDARQVIRSLRTAGFHLQLPPRPNPAASHGGPL
ncbi:MAG: YcgL domain-containing protein [Chromatiales bacterium]|jgi:uncharacterized protein YcgL (UPF0745 family)